MRKVVVDREEIEAARNTLANGGGAVGVLRWAESILAQPAEAEGPERWSELRALAESAPGKNWKAGNAYGKPFIPTYQVIADTVDGPCVILEGNKNFIEQAEAAATFAAAANPSAVLELLAALSAVTAERDRLRDQVKALQSDANSWQSGYDKGRHDGTKHRQSEVAQLRAEAEALRKDAERYRWLRDQAPKARGEWEIDGQRYGMMLGADQDDVDEAVDALMSAMTAKEA